MSAGDSVVIFGAGAIGLLKAMCARLRGAADVYVVDHIADRLDKAGELGCEPIDFTAADPVEQLLEHRRRLRGSQRAYRGEEMLQGVTRDRRDRISGPRWRGHRPRGPALGDPRAGPADPAGGPVGIIGVFLDSDPGAVGEPESHGVMPIPWGSLFKKGIHIGLGRDEDKRYNGRVRDLITTGQLRPSQIVSHRLPIDQAPDAYRRFDERRDGYLKVILSPNGA